MGDLHFCRFHLPWSSNDLRDRFRVDLTDAHPGLKGLKNSWTDEMKANFKVELRDRLSQNQDLTGIVAAGDVEIEHGSHLKFADAVFPGKFEVRHTVSEVDFRKAVFFGQVKYRSGVNGSLDASNARFLEEVEFAGTEYQSAKFDGCYFKKTAKFRRSQFRGVASFKQCVFCETADFNKAVFVNTQSLYFDGARFHGSARFRSSDPATVNSVSFRGASFDHDVGFEGRIFTSTLDFRGARFRRAPRFQDATISFESDFPGLEGFLDWRATPPEFANESKQAAREYYQGAAQAYRALRYAMKKQDAHDEEARFWELEMRAKERALAWNLSGFIPKLFSKLYAQASLYGNSIPRPILLWLATLFIFAAFVYSQFQCEAAFSEPHSFVRLIEFSLQQTVRPFGIWADEGAKTISRIVGQCRILSEGTIFLLRLIATSQSLISLTLLALFGFALRRRFRMA